VYLLFLIFYLRKLLIKTIGISKVSPTQNTLTVTNDRFIPQKFSSKLCKKYILFLKESVNIILLKIKSQIFTFWIKKINLTHSIQL